MKLKIEIDMENSAFDNESEISRILTEIVLKIMNRYNHNQTGRAYDINGNLVGKWVIE